ncbi:MAG: TonB-dependent receptor [Pseudomonadota bacterium]
MALNTIAPVTYAQESVDEQLEEVVITGSRILRRDFNSNSPIVTVDAGDFETRTGLNIESYLNQLPTYNPAATPTTSQGDVQITPVNSVGIASISLRGFGPNRSLVLVNGKRPTPINSLMVTDINAIPSALIQRVETITGGASATYGADAVSGVTNFILKDNFEGFEVDTQVGETANGDGQETRLSMVLGANLADGRGNVTLGAERYNRDAVLNVENDFYQDYMRNPYSGGTFGLQGINGYACNQNCPPNATIDGMFANRPAGTNVFTPLAVNANNRAYNFNSDGTIWVAGSAGGLSRYKGPVNDGEYMRQRALDGSRPPGDIEIDSLKQYDQSAFTSAPQERYSFFTSGTFDVTDEVEVFARATFAESKTKTTLFGTSVVGGWETMIPYNQATDSPVDITLDYTNRDVAAMVRANPAAFPNPNFIATGKPGAKFPVPAELAILLNARPVPTATALNPRAGEWQPNWNPDNSLPPRNTYNTNEVWQVETGFNIQLPISDWTAEVYASHGESATYNVATGNLSLARYRALANAPDYGRGAKISGNATSIRPNFGAADITCASGLYDTFFKGDLPMSEDCFNAIAANLQTRTQNKQDIIELNFQGALVDLPAGESRWAAGYQNRRNSAKFYPDILQSTVSFTDQVIGVYPTGAMDAGTSVDDYYAEALVPVVSDVPFIQMLELELGARYSDYQHTDAETTWKALANWEINDRLRIRGGFNRATRAPNLGEMFLNSQEIFAVGGQNFGDACGLRSNSPFGAGGALPDPQLAPGEPPTSLAPGQTTAGQVSTLLICQALMGGAGNLASQQFYQQANAGGAAGGVFNWILQEGNPNLTSETADTWTLGAVATSPWENPWLSGLTASFDAYRIEIEDAIMLYSLDYAAYRCFGTTTVNSAAAAATQAQSEACQLLPRDQNNGNALTSSVSYDNQATIKTQGLDIGVNWFGDLEELVSLPGNLGLSLQTTILDYYKTKQSPGAFDVETDWAGSLGPNLSGTNGGAYDWRLFGSMTYSLNDWSVSLSWRHLPEIWSAGYASQQAIKQNNAAVAAGGAGILLGYTPTTEIQTESYDKFDLSFNYNINETFVFRGGITNLFDDEPPYVNATRGYGAGTTLSAVCPTGAPGCQNPFSFSAPTSGTFNGGYYDTVGRSFFMGLKATF